MIPMKIIKSFGDWHVRPGGLWHKPMNYWIEKKCLNDPEWPAHIEGKAWSNHSEFMSAYRFAVRHWKIKVRE